MSSEKNPIENIAPLFGDSNNDEDGEWFRDKVRAIFEHFDTDQDKYLKYVELAALQKATAGTSLTEDMYLMACKALDSHPGKGISLDALKLTYAAEGSDIEKDYYKVFPDRNPKKKTKDEKKIDTIDEEDDQIYEIGADGTVDIS